MISFFAKILFFLVWKKHIKIYLQSWGRFIGSWKQGNTSCVMGCRHGMKKITFKINIYDISKNYYLLLVFLQARKNTITKQTIISNFLWQKNRTKKCI
jgi:hypothetical protein